MSERYVLDGKPLYTLEEYRRLKTAYDEAVAVIKQVYACGSIRTTEELCMRFLDKHQDSPTRANDQTTSD